MNRLTNFNCDGFIACKGCFEPQCTNCTEYKKQASRLSEYEDTGLEPAEITALQKDYKIAKTCICEFCRKRSVEQNNTMLCTGCKYLFKPKETLLICKKKDKFIIPTYPPNRCEIKEKR